jgi:hypothetical protein
LKTGSALCQASNSGHENEADPSHEEMSRYMILYGLSRSGSCVKRIAEIK